MHSMFSNLSDECEHANITSWQTDFVDLLIYTHQIQNELIFAKSTLRFVSLKIKNIEV